MISVIVFKKSIMTDFINLYDIVYDKNTHNKCIVVYVSDDIMDDSYLIDPIGYSFELDWREASDLEKVPDNE